jgi:uncharacterized membrane protein YeaQ/YmgE (transglycosylase-associated protein family)
MLNLIWWVIVGFVVGLIARALLPGMDHMGFIMTSLVGIGGSLLGGFLGSLVRRPPQGATFHRAGFVMSVVGAIILLILLRMIA